jgi:hypothetical protein
MAQLGTVFGSSPDGGDVRVRGEAIGGNGGTSGGMGASVALVDAISGSTTGALTLEQVATGGQGFVPGTASSSLQCTGSYSSLELHAEANGGSAREMRDSGVGPAGGSASSIAAAHNEAGASLAYALAHGGIGARGLQGALPGKGGDAQVTASASSRGANDVVVGAQFVGPSPAVSGAFGGIGGGDSLGFDTVGGAGGDATSSSEAIAYGDGNASVFDRAQGGRGSNGSQLGGDGGSASSTATARGAGSGRVVVQANADGGAGGSTGTFIATNPVAGAGGAARATASGFSDSGGDVEVTAVQTAGSAGIAGAGGVEGRSSEMRDAVHGGTAGHLSLTQMAVAGSSSGSGAGGSATSMLTSLNEGGGGLVQIAEARGGSGLVGGTALAAASGETEGAAPLSVRATAVGGAGGQFGAVSGNGGVASLGVVSGTSSGGGDVEVIGEVTGGAGGNRSAVAGNAGDGASETLENAVDGTTTGSLTLVQRASGGAGGSRSINSSGSAFGRAGSGTSHLAKDADVRSLTLVSEAFGGPAALSAPTGGGAAEASVDAINGSGSAVAAARAAGGAAASGSPGGTANLLASATTRGDGHAVQVGRAYAADPRLTETGAFGGGMGTSPFGSQIGGDATSQSSGIALGDSEVRVYDLAVGGSGNTAGGRATSQAFGTTAGFSSVDVNSLAIAGSGVRSGETSASADGRGLGAVSATATADASQLRLAAAGARAEASGSSGSANAEALAAGGAFARISAISEAPVTAASVVQTHADATGILPSPRLDGSADAFSYVTATGESPDVWGRAALGALDRQGLAGNDILLHSEAVFEQPTSGFGSVQALTLSFLSVELTSVAFKELRFHISNGNTDLVDETFGQMSDALAFFQGTLDLRLGLAPLDLQFVLDLESGGAGSGFSTAFALGTVPVPEPSTASMLVAGLLLLSAQRIAHPRRPAGRPTRRRAGAERRG